MTLSRFTPAQRFEIWEPRWKDVWENGERKKAPIVLLAKQRVGLHNEIVFTRTKSQRYQGKWYIKGEVAHKFPVGSNGTIPCLEVPFDKLEVLERE